MKTTSSLGVLGATIFSLALVGCGGAAGGPNGAAYLAQQQALNIQPVPPDQGGDWSYMGDGSQYTDYGSGYSYDDGSGSYYYDDGSGSYSYDDGSGSYYDDGSGNSTDSTDGSDGAVYDTYSTSPTATPAATAAPATPPGGPVLQVSNSTTATIAVSARTAQGLVQLGELSPGETISAHLDPRASAVTLSAKAVTPDASGVVPVLHDVMLRRLAPRAGAAPGVAGAAFQADGSTTPSPERNPFARVVSPAL